MSETTPKDVEFAPLNRQTWTNEIPRKSGFYWLDTGDDDPQIVKVVRGEDRIAVYPPWPQESFDIEDQSIFDEMAWAGPLQLPQ